VSIEARLQEIHLDLRIELPGIVRIAVAIYDRKTDTLKTFVHSTVGSEPLTRHEAKLAEVPSLLALATNRKDRIITDTTALASSTKRHSQVVAKHWGSSYTRPLFEGNRLRGFLFFDAVEKGYFTPAIVLHLAVYAELMAMILASSLFPMRLLHSALEVASAVSHERDPETGAHLDRMSRYARLIALGVADKHGLIDVRIEQILMYSPLHDIGKVAIPDHILLAAHRLDERELVIMRTHVTRGADMIDRLLARVGMSEAPEGTMLRNIVLRHHESWDGSGYPDGLKGEEIPLEARIVTVADVFDALTSVRPYKPAWTSDDAYAYLEERSGAMFDRDCVAAMVRARSTVEEIRQTFLDAPEAARLREGYDAEL
jgi:HD-GYP domain-containing protein (c-di-GMP phosphodiesterase class II)